MSEITILLFKQLISHNLGEAGEARDRLKHKELNNESGSNDKMFRFNKNEIIYSIVKRCTLSVSQVALDLSYNYTNGVPSLSDYPGKSY